MVGRLEERKSLLRALGSHESQFVAVYGRRRVGKTYLVRNTFANDFAFYHTGVYDRDYREQLETFRDSLEEYGLEDCPPLKTWREAFKALQRLLEAKPSGKKIVFIDELPWMDTRNSKFLPQLDRFWNKWASARNDIVLVVCGSAASWMIRNLIDAYGGLHDRITDRIIVNPFTLKECEAYAQELELSVSRRDIAEYYMVFGGIPYYWSYLERGMSVAQNIDSLLFARTGKLRQEFGRLFKSLFGNDALYRALVTALATKKCGMTREELLKATNATDGGRFSECLAALEECGFVRSFEPIGRVKKETLFQLIDNFTLFHFRFLEGRGAAADGQWLAGIMAARQNTWRGLAFERLCLQHLPQIKAKLGIQGVCTSVSSWVRRASAEIPKGAQIDLLIDRADKVINLCEMKWSSGPYELTREELERIERRRDAFVRSTGATKTINLTMVTVAGLAETPERHRIQNEVTLDDLFAAS